MSYAHLNVENIRDPQVEKLFRHVDMYLFDVYGMFRCLPPADGDGGGGNFSIVLVLLCIIDGLSAEIWPDRDVQKDSQEKRFKKLIRSKLYWGPEGKRKWADKGTAAAQLYTEFRNPLIHELARDKITSSRPTGYFEPIIGKWGSIPGDFQDIAKIDALKDWNDSWPVLSETNDEQGNPRLKLTAAALYWAVKRLAMEFVAEKQNRRA